MSQNSASAILLIEGAPETRRLYRSYLEVLPGVEVRVLTAATLAEGQELYRRHCPSLTLMALQLPDGSALAFLQRNQPQLTQAPVAVIAGEHEQRASVQALKLGARDVLTQEDVTAESLAQTVLTALNPQAPGCLDFCLLHQTILDNAPVSIIATDAGGTIQLFNRKAEAMLGYRAEEVVGKATPLIFHEPQEFQAYLDALSETLAPGEQPDFETFLALIAEGRVREQTFIHIRKDGSTFPALLSITPIWDSEGQIGGFVGITQDLSERQAQEQKLRDLTERLTIALTSGAIGTWEWNLENNCSYWDQRMYELHGVTELPAPGQDCQILRKSVHPEDRKRTEKLLQQAILGKADYDTEFRVVHPDQRVYHLKAYGKVIRDEKGKALKIVGVNYDITPQKTAEQELRQSRQFVQTLLDTMPVYVFWKDRDSRFLGCNQPLADLMGVGEPEAFVEQANQGRLFTPEELRGYQVDDQAVIESGYPKLRIQETITLPNGETRWLETQKAPLRDYDGNIIGVVGVFQDVTERRRAEEALSISEERFRSAFENTAVGMSLVAINPGGLILQCNRALCKLLGYSESELLNLTFQELTHPDDRERSRAFVQRRLAGEIDDYHLEKRYFTKSGEIIWALVSVSLVADRQKNPLYLVVQIQDITARKKAEAELYQEQFRLNLALDAAQMGFWRVHLQSDTLQLSERAESILGYGPGTFPGQRALYIQQVHPQDRPLVIETVNESFATGASYHLEYRIRRPDGAWRWVEVWGLVQDQLPEAERQMLGVIQDITDRKETERQLEESRIKFQRLVDDIGDKFVVFSHSGAEGILNYLSDGVKTVFGIEKEAALGQSWSAGARWLSEDMELAGRLLEEMMTGQAEFNQFEMRFIHPNGALKTIFISQHPVRNEAGELIAVEGIVEDITEDKAAEKALRESEEKFRVLAENIPAAVYRYVLHPDGSHQFIYVNPYVREIYGVEPEAVIQDPQTLFDKVHPEDRAALQEAIALSAQNLSPFYSEHRIFCQSGQLKWVQVIAVPAPQSNGDILWQGVILDVSPRKEAEKALRQSQEFIQTVINTIPLPLFWKNQDSVYLGCNPALANLLNFQSPQEIVGKTDFDLSLTLEQALTYRGGDQRVIQSGRPELALEETHLLPNGETQWIETHKAPLRDGENTIIGVVGMFQDITERKNSQLQLQQKNAELERLLALREEALTLREDMSNMLVHDLRNPLGSILLAADLIQRYVHNNLPAPIILGKVESIIRSGARLEKMIDTLLFMARLEAGKLIFTPIPTDLAYLGNEVLADFEFAAQSRQIRLRGKLPLPGRQILVDASILRRVIDNLVSNALKFTPSGGEVSLEISYLDDNRLRVQVADTGPGIDEVKQAKIFEKFEIGAVKQNVAQIGLGLAFCKLVVESQGGTLSLAPNQPQGAVFTVEL
ncbi:MAG: PAS domain S-box protein [Cyanobacteria bacterium RI_101]|nr:PAS domain S-box protein [Cyanobacteria bacterium RI_101]